MFKRLLKRPQDIWDIFEAAKCELPLDQHIDNFDIFILTGTNIQFLTMLYRIL